jgi:hypothetical protein
MKDVIRVRQLCWTGGQMVESGGPGQRRKVYQNNVAYHVVGHGPGYWILRRA